MSDWLKMEKHTPEKPEILAMSSLLSLDPEIVFTKCFKVWRWADSQTVDGNAPGVTAALLDSLVSVTGFGAALVKVGWLNETTGAIVFPNFGYHMGESAKKRDLSGKRVKALRKRNAQSVTEALPDKTRQEETRIEEGETPLPPSEKPTAKKAPRKPPKEEPIQIPPALDTPEFRQAWLNWQQHLREKKKPPTPTAQRQQLRKLAALGQERAIAALEHSTAANYQGVFEPTPTGNGGGFAKKETREEAFARITREHEEKKAREQVQ